MSKSRNRRRPHGLPTEATWVDHVTIPRIGLLSAVGQESMRLSFDTMTSVRAGVSPPPNTTTGTFKGLARLSPRGHWVARLALAI
jgi:hypothetical protein